MSRLTRYGKYAKGDGSQWPVSGQRGRFTASASCYNADMDITGVNRNEIYRYLGAIGGASPDETMRALTEDVLRELSGKVRPGHVSLVVPLTVTPEDRIDMTCMQIRSKSLFRNLRGCDEALLFAATLGDGADFLIRRYEKTDMARATVCQAASAAMIEAYCDEINDAWKKEYKEKGCFLRPRFSCGYGDFPLTCQKRFLEVLQADKRLGIRLTEGLLMVPTKSVTAVIGIGSLQQHEKDTGR